MIFLYAFLAGGLVCGLSQIFLDKTKFNPIHLTVGLVVIGALLDTFSVYDAFVDVAEAGAMIPITSFGHSLLHGALEEANDTGIIGIGIGMFDLTSSGITSAIVFAFLVSLISKPKG